MHTESTDTTKSGVGELRAVARLSDTAPANYDLDTIIQTLRQFRDSGLIRPTVGELSIALAGEGSPNSAKNKLYTAAKYGFIEMRLNREKGRNEVVMLPLGEEVLDPQKERSAKVRAFLNVPLNRAIYNRYRDQPLPSGDELDRVLLEELYIAPGQSRIARRVIMRSASMAGLFEQGRNRWVIPNDVMLPEEAAMPYENPSQSPLVQVNGTPDDMPPPLHATTAERQAPPTTLGEQTPPHDERTVVYLAANIPPPIATWLQEIPGADKEWSDARRKRWLEMMENLFNYYLVKE